MRWPIRPTSIRSPSCLCGAVTFEVSGELAAPDACHCRKCRKQSGHFFASTDVPKSALRVEGEDRVVPAHRSSLAVGLRRRPAHHRHRHHARHHRRLSRRQDGRGDQRLHQHGAGRARPAALSGADDADPGHRADQCLPRLRHHRHVGAGLGADVARGARQDAGAGGASNMCAPPWRSAPRTGASSCSTSCPM